MKLSDMYNHILEYQNQSRLVFDFVYLIAQWTKNDSFGAKIAQRMRCPLGKLTKSAAFFKQLENSVGQGKKKQCKSDKTIRLRTEKFHVSITDAPFSPMIFCKL